MDLCHLTDEDVMSWSNFCLFFVLTTFLWGPVTWAQKCITDIRVNELQAVISVDGVSFETNQLLVNCKSVPQKIVVTAPDQKSFTRMLPSSSEFTPADSFWNIRLEEYSDFNSDKKSTNNTIDNTNAGSEITRNTKNQDSEIQSMAALVAELGQLRKRVWQLEKSVHKFQFLLNPVATKKTPVPVSHSMEAKATIPAKIVGEQQNLKTSANVLQPEIERLFPVKKIVVNLPLDFANMINPLNFNAKLNITEFVAPVPFADRKTTPELATSGDRKPASSELITLEYMSGLFIQIEAIHGLQGQKHLTERKVSSLGAQLVGQQITICPTHIVSLSQNWTKVLVGPVKSKQEADVLAKKYGRGSFSVTSPLCETHLKTSFRVGG